MPVDVSTSTLPDVTPIHRLIRTTRHLLRSTWVITGAALTAGFFLSALFSTTLLDLLAPLGVVLRCIALAIVVVPAAWAFVAGVLRPLFRRLSSGQVARRIETHLPGIHNRLVSCIDLSKNRGSFQQSPAFYRRLLTEALDRIRNFRPRAVLDFLSLRRAGYFAGGSAAAFLLMCCLFADRVPTALARIFLPLADIPPASGVLYAVSPGDAKVLHGEDVTFAVRAEKGEPEKLWVELRGDGGRLLQYDLVREKQDGSLWKFIVNSASLGAGFENAFRYRVHGGGTWSKQYQIRLVERPAIVTYHTVLHYPPYMGIDEPREGPPQTLDVTGPEGSQVDVVVQADGNVAEAEIQMLAFRARPASSVNQPGDSGERIWFEDKLPAGATRDGTWQWDSDKHRRPTHTEPPALGAHGHWFHGAAEALTLQPHESLFTYVYIVPGQEPETIMLEWHDGTDWEHRAVWGKDTIRLGKPDSLSRRRVGDLPAAGQWVRLQVPAEAVGLEGKTIRGMSFKLSGGQCYWHRAGAVPPTLAVVSTVPMQPREGNRWSGQFLLRGTGLYRVELRNELGHPSKPMKEGKFTATPDLPPQVVLERPGSDLTLSEPGKVPLVIAAFDDFGLADLTLMVHRSDTGKSERRLIKEYTKPLRNDSVVSAIDLAELKLPMNSYVRYRVEARDRRGQAAQTQEFLIRLAADPNAADKQLAAFDKSQDPFGDKLANLIAEQTKVHEGMQKLAVKYAPLIEQVEAARSEARPAPEGSPQTPTPNQTPETVKLDPKLADVLKPFQQELAQLAAQEQKNTQLAQQMASDLAKSAEDAGKMPLMPRDIAEQMSQLQRLFQQSALQPMQDLANRLQQGGQPKSAPDMKGMQSLSSRLQKELESLQSRLRALAKARRNMRGDLDDALAKLRRDLLRENSSLTKRELEELREHIAKLREELKRLGVSQERLSKEMDNGDERAMQKKQEGLDKQLARLLDDVKELLGDSKARRMKRRPDFPDAPYDPETGEQKVPPKEEDTDEPDAGKKKDAKGKNDAKTAKGKNEKMEDDEEEPLFMPGLGGPKPKLDPRYAKKLRPVKNKGSKKDVDSNGDRQNEPQSRQQQALQELDMAQQALSSDEQSLRQMLQQLEQALSRSNSRSGRPSGQNSGPEDDSGSNLAEQLAQLLNSPSLQQALAMAARMRQGRGSQSSGAPSSGQNPGPSQALTGNLSGGLRTGDNLNAELGKLDPQSRSVILRMQPKLREELLQGMREAGPEGYQKFIDDYFKRLAEVKKQ